MLVSTPKTWFTASLLDGTTQLHMVKRAKNATIVSKFSCSLIEMSQRAQCSKERIREMFKKVELSVSPYDTAWVAMVPSMDSPQQPCFPQCLNWLLENQLHDGSWSLPCRHRLLIKDSMLSTLACVIALRRWDIGDQHIRKGLDFIGSNSWATIDKNQLSPIGFDITFPGMIEYARDLGLSLPLSSSIVESMLSMRDFKFERACRSNIKEHKAHLAYVYEGLTKLYDGKGVMEYQRKNGSLFNSPSTTAAALIQHKNVKCSEYLQSLLERFGNAVPTVYPMDVYIRLSMVDRLERLGIERHFRNEIDGVLDETYRYWVQKEEEIFLDAETCALAFRLLRSNGYDISSDALAEFNKQKYFFSSASGNLKDIYTVLELYKASQIMIYRNEPVLETLHSWTSQLLKQNQTNVSMYDENLHNEVDHALKFTYDISVERLEHRRYIECYNVDNVRVMKTSYRCTNIENRDLLQLAVEDYNFCQGIHRKELEDLHRWMKENKLDQLKFARQKLTYVYFSVTCILFTPELSDARLSWAKNAVLATVVDDFFDVGGSKEELVNLVELVEKWDGTSANNYCSEQVEIIFLTLYKTVNELGISAFTRQGRSVTNHLIDLWLTLLKSMMREYEWGRDKLVPTMDEYMENACISFALGPVVLIALYFIGPKISEEAILSPEYTDLFKHLNICGRLCNDIQGFKREGKEGKLNSVLLYMIHGRGSIPEEEAVREIRTIIDRNKQDLLSLVLQTKESVVTKACRDLFWKTSRVIHLFYSKNDGFTSPVEMVDAVNSVLYEPIRLLSSTL